MNIEESAKISTSFSFRVFPNINIILNFVSRRVNGEIFMISYSILGRVSAGIIVEEEIKRSNNINIDAVIVDS